MRNEIVHQRVYDIHLVLRYPVTLANTEVTLADVKLAS